MAKFKKQLGILSLALVPLAIGLAVGLALPFDFIRDRVVNQIQESQDSSGHGHDHGHAHGGGASGQGNLVELSETAQTGMGLRTGRLQRGEFQTSFVVPGFVREVPGASNLVVAGRFAGIVRKVFISEGQQVVPGQPILEVELTGDLLATAQSELLAAKKQIEIVDREIKRIEPSVRSGGVASKRLLDKQYERDRLIANLETKTQELLVRGLTADQVNQIIEQRQLLRTVTVHVPKNLVPPQLNADEIMQQADETFLVEELNAKPGSMISAGANYCMLSFHSVLVVEGQAYESDLDRVRDAVFDRLPIKVAIGPDDNEHMIADQRVAYLSNHVDESTNTYPFYIYMQNTQVGSPSSNTGSDLATGYVAWKWKPGQRSHVEIPDQRFDKVIVIPRGALAVDGLNNFVFRWNGEVECEHDHAHHHGPGEDHDDEHHEHIVKDQYEAIEVNVTHLGRRQVIIELSDDLKLGDRIAFNHASQLLFAMQNGNGGGGGHSHDH